LFFSLELRTKRESEVNTLSEQLSALATEKETLEKEMQAAQANIKQVKK